MSTAKKKKCQDACSSLFGEALQPNKMKVVYSNQKQYSVVETLVFKWIYLSCSSSLH